MQCVNIKSKEFQELLEASKLPSLLLEMKISQFQDVNGIESYPTIKDLTPIDEVVDISLDKKDLNEFVDESVKPFFEERTQGTVKNTKFEDNKKLLFGSEETTKSFKSLMVGFNPL